MFTALVSCVQCADVRLGDDGRALCLSVEAVHRVSLLIRFGSGHEEQVLVYNNSQNVSTEKYILAADFSAVIVRNMTISDEGVYRCTVSTTDGETSNTEAILSVFGESFRSLCLLIPSTLC